MKKIIKHIGKKHKIEFTKSEENPNLKINFFATFLKQGERQKKYDKETNLKGISTH